MASLFEVQSHPSALKRRARHSSRSARYEQSSRRTIPTYLTLFVQSMQCYSRGPTSHHDADHHSRAHPIQSPSSTVRITSSAAQSIRVADAVGADLPLLHSAISAASCHSPFAARSSAPRRRIVGIFRGLTYAVSMVDVGRRLKPTTALVLHV